MVAVKAAFHEADTDTDILVDSTDIPAKILARMSARKPVRDARVYTCTQ